MTTAKINTKAVTDEKINSVSASKVTGLHKVATSGSYNDLTDKPTIPSGGGGGFNTRRYDFYLGDNPTDLETGIYLCFVVFTNRASFSNVACLGTITYSPDCENGSYSGISSIYDSGEQFKIQLEMHSNGKISLISSGNERESPYNSGYDGDGVFKITLIKLSNLGQISCKEDEEETPTPTPSTGTWKFLDTSAAYLYGDWSSHSIEAPVEGLKAGEPVKGTIMNLKLNVDPSSPSYYYNTPDGVNCYGFTLTDNGWHQHTSDSDWDFMNKEFEISSEQAFVTEVGLIEYGRPNKMTIKIACKRDGYITMEFSDQAGFYVEMAPMYMFYAKR